MKKSLIIACMLAACTFCCQKSYSQFYFGAKAGFNMSTQSRETGANIKHPFTPGFNAGVFGEYFFVFDNELSLSAEILYSMEGYTSKSDNAKLGKYTNKTFLNYINVPVLLSYYLLNDRLALHVGPQFGFCIGGKEKYKYENKIADTRTDHPMQKEFEPEKNLNIDDLFYNVFDLGLVIGANFYFTENIFAGLRYETSFTNSLDHITPASKAKAKFEYEAVKSKNQVISLNVGYRF